MTRRMMTPCAYPGCPVPTRDRYCPEHAKLLQRRYDRERGSAASRGYDARWRKARAAFLRRHPLCWDCRARGRLAAAAVVDHVIPHEGDQELFWATENWQPLCERCHNSKTAREADGLHRLLYPRDLRGSTRPVTLVAGPPAAGKTTYARGAAAPDDAVLDLDEIIAMLSGQPMYRADDRNWLRPALQWRNQRLRDLTATPAPGRIWLIAGAPRRAERWFWQARLGAEVVVLDVPPDECKRRIEADSRRAAVREAHLRAVDEWWWAYRTSLAG